MENVNATPQEIYEVLEQQKKLQEMRAKLVTVLDKVNQSINAITVENIELTSSQIDELSEAKDEVEQKSVIQYSIDQQEKRTEEINQQIIDLELKFSHYETESDEDVTDLDFSSL